MKISVLLAGIGMVSLFFMTAFNKPIVPGNDLKSSMTRGKEIYERVCIACHQADAGGVPRMIPPLIKTKWVIGDKKIFAGIVLNGLQGGEIEIEGDTFSNPMPGQADLMTDQQIADVITYVRNSFGNKSSQVFAADVKAVRAAKK
jgi:hypothetical protein